MSKNVSAFYSYNTSTSADICQRKDSLILEKTRVLPSHQFAMRKNVQPLYTQEGLSNNHIFAPMYKREKTRCV